MKSVKVYTIMTRIIKQANLQNRFSEYTTNDGIAESCSEGILEIDSGPWLAEWCKNKVFD